MNATAASGDHPSARPLTWTLVHAEPGALVYAAPGLQPIHASVRRAQASRWVPQGTPAAREDAADTHGALHYVEYLGLVGVLAAALGVGAALAGQSAVASAEPTESDSSTSSSATESSATETSDTETSASETSDTAAEDSDDARTSAPADENDDTAALSEAEEENEPLAETDEAPAEPTAATPDTGTVTGLLDTLGLGPVDGTAGPTADSPTFQVTGGPADGTVTIAPDATFTYSSTSSTTPATAAPDTAPTDLADNFTVTVSDPRGEATTVQVTVAPEPAAGAGTSLVLTGSGGAADEVHVALSPTDSDEAGRLVVHSSAYPADAASALTVESIAVGRSPQQVAANPVLPLVYVANQVDKTVTVVDRTTGGVVATIPVGGSATAVAVTPDGTRAYVTIKSFLGKVAVIDTATNTVVTTVRVGSHPTALAVSPDGARLYVANNHGHTVSVIDTATNKAVDANPSFFATRIRVGAYPSALALSADGTRLYVANAGSNSVSVVDTTTYRTVDANPSFFATRVRVGSSPSALAVAPDGSQVYVANTASDTVSVIDVDAAANTYRVVDTDPSAAGTQSIFVGCAPTSVAISADGARVYAALSSDMVAVIDTASHAVSLTQIDTAPESGAHSLALGPDGQVYVIDAADQTLRSMPAVDGAVTMGRSALVLPDTGGFTVDATWYFPNRADAPAGLIYLQHGAWRSDIYVSALAQHLADRTNSIVVTPTFASEVLARYNVAGTRVAEAVTALFAGDRAALAASAAAAAGHAVLLPQQFVLAGHSAGGKLVAVVAGYLADAGAVGDLAGVVMFDPFSDGDATAGLAKLTGANAVPAAMISAAPCAWNGWGENTIEIIDAAPASFVAIRLDGGSHIDAEGASSDALGMVGCGESLPQNAAALQTITAGWITDFFTGSHNGIYGPQGTPVAVSGATGTVIAANG